MSTLFSYFFEKYNQIRPQEHIFTEVLGSIATEPEMLYFYGKMPENMAKTLPDDIHITTQSRKKSSVKNRTKRLPSVAIVGSRRNTRYGEEVAYKMSYALAKHGVVVVSGLAFGIDSIAHRAALDAGGLTVAVLGTPIDRIYPRRHEPLAREIVEKGGAILSEYAPNTRSYPETSGFLERNRLISGLADVVVVVEAAERSGSLNTASHALNQGKEVFAVPGNITNPLSQGCNKLIKQGANPYTCPEDLLRLFCPELFIKKRKKPQSVPLFGDSAAEMQILQALSAGLRSGESIIEKTGLSIDSFNEAITLLEIKGQVHALGMNNWALT